MATTQRICGFHRPLENEIVECFPTCIVFSPNLEVLNLLETSPLNYVQTAFSASSASIAE